MNSVLLQACLVFAKISVFAFGGGYAVLGLIQSEIVERFAWLTMDEYLDVVAIAEMTPGPIAVNAATFVGNRLGGVLGGVFCTLSFLIVPFIIAVILAICFLKVKDNKWVQVAVKGIRPVAIAIVANAALKVVKTVGFSWPALIILAAAALITFVWKKGPILTILISGVLGIIFYGFVFV